MEVRDNTSPQGYGQASALEIAGSLDEIEGLLQRTLVPVEPPAAFVHSLGRELVKASRRSQRLTKRARRGLIIGAAALGSAASIASVVTLLLLRKRAQSTPPLSG